MTDYRKSTQLLKWTFKPEDLLQSAEAAAEQAAASGASERAATPPVTDAVTAEEETLMQYYFQHKIQAICSEIKHFPHKVQATAITYFLRCFARQSMLDLRPAAVALTAIYLAAKVEEAYISAEHLGTHVKLPAEVLLKMEPKLLQMLASETLKLQRDFMQQLIALGCSALGEAIANRLCTGSLMHVVTLHPYTQDLRQCPTDAGVDAALADTSSEAWQKAKQRAYAAADVLLRTDAPLLFSPGQLALAALRSAFRKGGVALASYLQRVVEQSAAFPAEHAAQHDRNDESAGPGSAAGTLSDLETALDAIDALAKTARDVSLEQFTAVNNKLNAFNNYGASTRAKGEKKKEKKAARQAKRKAEEDSLCRGNGNGVKSNFEQLLDGAESTPAAKKARVEAG